MRAIGFLDHTASDFDINETSRRSLGTEYFIKGTGKELTLRSMPDASVKGRCKLAIQSSVTADIELASHDRYARDMRILPSA